MTKIIDKNDATSLECVEMFDPLSLMLEIPDGDYAELESIIGEFSEADISVPNVLEITDRLKDFGRVKNAIYIVTYLFDEDENSTSVCVKLGEYYYLDGQAEKTIELYRKAATDRPAIKQTFWYRKNIGEAFFHSQQQSKAMENLRIALTYCDGDFEKYHSLVKYFAVDNSLSVFFDEVNKVYSEELSQSYIQIESTVDTKDILVIDSCVPQIDKDAGSVLMQGFLRTLSQRGYNVWFYTDEKESSPKYILNLLSIGVRYLDRRYFENGNEMVAHISPEIDAVMLTRVDSGGNYFEVVKRFNLTKPIIFNTVDLHFLRTQRHFEKDGNPATRLEAKRQKRRESFLIRNTDATIVISDAERKLLENENIIGNIWQIPIIVDFPDEVPDFSLRSKNVAFIGSYAHLPNIDAIDYFCTFVWPTVHLSNKDTKLIIVGPNVPERWMNEFHGKNNVEVRGFVENLDEFLAEICCTVVPLRVGAGQKGKIATSLAHGVPCISSLTGIEGMNLVDGETVAVCDDPSEWAETIWNFINNEDMWSRLSAAGIIHASENYSEAKVAGKLVEKLDGLISSPLYDSPKEKKLENYGNA